ncbi:hypothetical protein BGZ96_009131 [Linnemannia gamsii]|uniref:Uncharacterized protein n=1 Tax=Linnemannia gamsii TaxID=64522 RepID=A0ABQ7KF68_9FUNG|nr:hypothetical protein BGZ96_009131 [Linnemannia gamsii]
MKYTSLLLLLIFLPFTLSLHCWRDLPSCNPGFRRLYDSKCDTPKNRLPDLRPFKSAVLGFCKNKKDVVFRIRARDRPSKLPSAVVCAGNRHSRNAATYAAKLAKAVKRKYPSFAKGGIVKCCEGGKMNKGCA